MKRLILCLLVIGFDEKWARAHPHQGAVQPSESKPVSSPKATIQKWSKAIEGRSPDAILACYADSKDLTVTFASGEELRGLATVQDFYRKQFRIIDFSKSELSDFTVKEEHDAATVTCRHRLVQQLLWADDQWEVNVRMDFDLTKQKDSWRIVREKSALIEGVPRVQAKRLSLQLSYFDRNRTDGFSGTIESVAADGTLKVNVKKGNGPIEGSYAGMTFAKAWKPTKVFRVHVTGERKKKTDIIRVAAAAAQQLKPGEAISVDRPVSEELLKSLPDFVLVADPEPPPGMIAKDVAHLKTSQDRLQRIGGALWQWADDHHSRFPPAVIFGPDGKPWHSWRVLILPYLGEQALYQQYKFDEPWDGPNNKKLLEKKFSIYRDPIYGESNDAFTHYAAAVGRGTAFPPEGVKTDDPKRWIETKPKDANAGQTRVPVGFPRGTPHTLVLGSVSPERKIPWTKPEDVTFDDSFPPPGKPGSFATPYRSARAAAGVFLWADTSTGAIAADIYPEMWRDLWRLRITRNSVGRGIPDLVWTAPAGMMQEPAVLITWEKGKPTTKQVLELQPPFFGVEELDSLPVGIKVACEPNPALAIASGAGKQQVHTWWHKISVSALGKPVRILTFRTFVWEEKEWVADSNPLSPKVFARWYSCPDALLKAGKSYVDPTAWTAERELRPGKARWYFVGLDDERRLVKGDAVIELKAELHANKAPK